MQIIKKISKISTIIDQEKLKRKKIAIIPTMGAIHDGHLALVKKAKNMADIVVVTIFVNKAQFNDHNDYLKYPNKIESDIKNLQKLKIDYLFLPSINEIYPPDFSYTIIPNALTNCLCGSTRPGHFEGVSLIITKLFNIIRPDIAIFGQKDFQQLLVVKKLVKDLNFNIKIYGHKIIRDKNGLALSSRNARLSDDELKKAPKIHTFLTEIKNHLTDKVKSKANFDLASYIKQKKTELLNSGFKKIDYLEIRQEADLNLVQKFNPHLPSRIFIAVYLGKIRLIDNLKL